MKYRIRQMAEKFAGIFAGWTGVEAVMVNEDAEADPLDPAFALIFDVFYTSPIPAPAARAEAYQTIAAAEGTIAALESAPSKDRFLVGSVPVHVEFKSASRIDELVCIATGQFASRSLRKDAGTYGFYRLVHAEVFVNKCGWITQVREKLAVPGDEFWREMREEAQSKMEHFLIDLGEAYRTDDGFNRLVSAASFVKSACLTLFCVNRRFEPSHRAYYTQVRTLPSLPPEFNANLDAFLSPEAALKNRRYVLAKTIAMGIVAM